MLMSRVVDRTARKAKGKKAIAVKAFARSLLQISMILSDNARYDSGDLVTRLRATQYEGQTDAGLCTCLVCMYRAKHATDDHYIDMNERTTGSMRKLGITGS